MPIIVNTGSTLTVLSGAGLTFTNSATVASGGLLDGSGTIAGSFILLNQGTISADVPNATLDINTSLFTNQGTIIANNATFMVQSSVGVTNLSGGTLTGGNWDALGTGVLALRSGQIVTDDATIILNGTSSTFDGTNPVGGALEPIDNSLITVGTAGVLSLLNGRNFAAATSLVVNGTVTIGGGTLSAATNGLTIGATGHIVGDGAIDAGTPVFDSGTIEAAGGTLTMPEGGNITGAGTLQADAGASLALPAFGSYSQTIINNGTIDAVFANLTGILGISGPYSGTGGFLIEGGFDSGDRAILELPGSVSANVAFETNFGELLLDSATSFNGTISGFGNDSMLVLSGVTNAVNASLVGNSLKLSNSLGTVVQSIAVNTSSMNYSGASFSVSESGSKATVTVSGAQPIACFAAGTRISTQTGEARVEDLVAGDIVLTRFSGTAKVVWTGSRHLDCRRHAEPGKVWPVRISPNAFAPGIPRHDLFLSPDHAVYVDGVLIPVKLLINGVTITQPRMDEVTYYHIELCEHDVVYAEGMQAESYLESGDRADFENSRDQRFWHIDFAVRRWEALGCAPLVLSGPKLNRVKAQVDGRASMICVAANLVMDHPPPHHAALAL